MIEEGQGIRYAEILAGSKAFIKNSRIRLEGRWFQGGSASDPKYLKEEVNIRLTDDGYLVGKMAYFFDKSEEPVYITLAMNEKSIPIPLINAKQAKIVARDGLAV